MLSLETSVGLAPSGGQSALGHRSRFVHGKRGSISGAERGTSLRILSMGGVATLTMTFPWPTFWAAYNDRGHL